MTRGKYAARAATRRNEHEVTQTIDAYQRKIREQLAEIQNLKASLAAAQTNHEREARRLIAERDESVSPILEVVQREAVTLKEERDEAVADAKEIRKRWGRIIDNFLDHAKEQHHMTGLEACEWMLTLIDPDQSVTIADGFMKDLVDKWPGLPPPKIAEAMRRIQRARGDRHS